jgi:cell division protein ZapA
LAQVSITINQRSYRFACSDAEADRLRRLVAYLTETVARLTADHGQIGDERLALMAALTIADEWFDARNDIDDLLSGAGDGETVADDEDGDDAPRLELTRSRA